MAEVAEQPRFVVRRACDRHLPRTKHWGDGSFSYRRVLPDLDGVPFIVTEFYAKAGCLFPTVRYKDDEFVYIVSGRVRVTFGDGVVHELEMGGLYIAMADARFRFEALQDSILICSHTRTEGGQVPVDY